MAKDKEKKPDISDNSTMSLGDHLEELRARLILALLGLAVGCVISIFFGKFLIAIVETPYIEATQEYAKEKEAETGRSEDFFETLFINIIQSLDSDPNAPDIDPNLVTYVQNIYNQTKESLDIEVNFGTGIEQGGSLRNLQALAPADPFMAYMKITLIAGLILSSPWVFYQLWMFIAAGLYAHERRYVTRAVPFSVILFVCGALFFLFVVAEITLKFFIGFGYYIGVTYNWTFQLYISYVTMLMLVFGIAFQTPIAVYILNKSGLVSIKSLVKSRKFIILIIVILAAVATPPDPVSQISLAIPLYGLFELGVLMCWLSSRKKKAVSE